MARRRAMDHRRWLMTVAYCAFWLLCAGAVRGQDAKIDIELWVAWGGGSAERWQGEIGVQSPSDLLGTEAPIRSFVPVGLSPDEPGAIYLDKQRLVVAPRTPRTYDAVRFRVHASPEAQLIVRLAADEQAESVQQVSIPLGQLASEIHSSLLDDRGNRLLIRRVPGDDLRVLFERDSLVFSPGEVFSFDVEPHLLPLEANETLVYSVQLRRARSEDVIWEEARNAKADGAGQPPKIGPFSITLPSEPGAYDVWVNLGRRRFPTRFSPLKSIKERSVQLVVVASDPVPAPESDWQVTVEWPVEPEAPDATILSSPSKLFKLLPKLPSWNWIPGTSSQTPPPPFGNGHSSKRTRTDREWVELQAGGWLGYVLPVSSPGRPHVVEIEYPEDIAQTLSVSILEPDADGVVSPIGRNFGLDIPNTDGRPLQMSRYRVVFWPRTDRPLLLLTNRRTDQPAWLGRVRVLNGPQTLPVPTVTPPRSGRLLGMYLNRPLLGPAFGATNAQDPITGRNLTDWSTFYQASDRLSQVVKYAGYGGAMLAVTHDAGTLYPSRWLRPTPRYDNGIFFGTAQDPFQKDVLELLFRTFDREGLQLVPLMHFSTPLPELEALRRGSARDRDRAGDTSSPSSDASLAAASVPGIDLVASDGRSWLAAEGATRPAGPIYNPLDPRVQSAMQRVVTELVDRYAHHPSFAGVAVHLGPDSYAQFPDAYWGCDATTLKRFATEAGFVSAGDGNTDHDSLIRYIHAGGRERWLQWRAAQLAKFYRALGSQVQQRNPSAKLYLAGTDMLTGPQLQTALQPRLPEQQNVESALLRVGFSGREYPNDEQSIVLLRPYRLAPLASLENQAVNFRLRRNSVLDAVFAGKTTGNSERYSSDPSRMLTGSVLFHEPQSLTLPSFQETSPFGAEKTAGWLLSQISPAGIQSRQPLVHSLATLDSQFVFVGGWTVPMGKQDELASITQAFRQLPAGRFKTVPSRSLATNAQPVVVRTLISENHSFFYVVNDSPWPVAATLELDAPANCPYKTFGSRQVMPPVREGARMSWTLTMEPYDLVVLSFEAPDVKVVDWRLDLDRDVLVRLRSGIGDFRRRADHLRNPKPLDVLGNADLELLPKGELLPGWDYSREAGVSVTSVSGQGRKDTRGLHIRSAGPVAWVRSNSFPTPKTGRLSVWMWLRVDDPNQQPPLQLAVEGRLDGEIYYRPAQVGANVRHDENPPPALTDQWAPYLVRVDNLPTSGLTDLRVAIDLMGAGEVWVDDVQVFDLWFDKNERNELVKTVALASYYLGRGDAIECHRILGGYWPEFLRRHVSSDDPQLATRPAASAAVSSEPADNPDAEAESERTSKSWLKRIVPKAPRLPTWFR